MLEIFINIYSHALRVKNLLLGLISKQLHEMKDDIPTDKPIVVICTTGNRSAIWAIALAKAGFKSVYNVTGGMGHWKAANMPVKQGKPK